MRSFVIRKSSIVKCPTAWPLLFIVFIAKSSNRLFLSWARLSFLLSVGTQTSIKVETTNSSWKHNFFVVIHADKNCFAFVLFTTLMWFECNVIQQCNVIGEKKQSSPGNSYRKFFFMKTIEWTLLTSYFLWLTHNWTNCLKMGRIFAWNVAI